MARAARKQVEMAQYAPKRNDELEDAMFIAHGFKQDLAEVKKKLEEANATLATVAKAQIESKVLTLPPEAATGKRVKIHTAERDGERIHLRWGQRGPEVTVKVAKPGESDGPILESVPDADDADDAEDLIEDGDD